MCQHEVRLETSNSRRLDAIEFCSQHGQSCFSLLLARTIRVTSPGQQQHLYAGAYQIGLATDVLSASLIRIVLADEFVGRR